MIAALKGIVAEKNLSDAVVDVNGVGYRVLLSLLSLSALPEAGQSVSLRIRTIVREDALDLFGFLTRTEEDLFSAILAQYLPARFNLARERLV